jgi:phosphorylcholine metabolism protein LicD
MIPWDDDMDISVWKEDLHSLVSTLSCVQGYVLRVQVSENKIFFVFFFFFWYFVTFSSQVSL